MNNSFNKSQNGLYTIYDIVADDTAPVFEAKNDDVAIRKFNEIMQNSPGITPTDYELRRIGYLYRSDGSLVFTEALCTLVETECHIVDDKPSEAMFREVNK